MPFLVAVAKSFILVIPFLIFPGSLKKAPPTTLTDVINLLNIIKTGPTTARIAKLPAINCCTPEGKFPKASAKAPNLSAKKLIAGAQFCIMLIDKLSKLPFIFSTLAFTPLFAISAVLFASPLHSLYPLVSFLIDSPPSAIRAIVPLIASCPKTCAMNCCFCLSVKLAVDLLKLSIILFSGSIFPCASYALKPYSFIAFAASLDGLESLVNIPLKVVPACDPIICLLAITPKAAVTSSKLCFAT